MTSHKIFNISDSLLTWDEIMDMFYINHGYENGLQMALPYAEVNDGKNKYNAGIYTFILQDIPSIEKYKERTEYLAKALDIDEFRDDKLKQNFYIDYCIYMSFTPKAKSHGVHRDTADVFHWQQRGQTTFTVWDDKEYTYVLNPGDCIFIPAGMYHDTLPLTPRAGISYAFFPGDYEGGWAEDYYKRKNKTFSYVDPFPVESKIFKL